jgi:hypothetical protein
MTTTRDKPLVLPKDKPLVLPKKELDWERCPKHGTRYPAGSECPVCKRERQPKGSK